MDKKDGQTDQIEYGTPAFKTFQSILGLLGLKFGTRHNTLYGITDVANMLVTMASHRRYANSAHEHKMPKIKMPSDKWILNLLRPIKHHNMSDTCDKMITKSVGTSKLKLERRNKKCKPVVVAIDKHKIPHYDKKPDMKNMIFSKSEHGTKLFSSYITAKIVAGLKEMHLCMEKTTRGKFNPEFVCKILQKCANMRLGISLYLLDREFFSNGVARGMMHSRLTL